MRRFALLSGLAVAGVGALWGYRMLATTPFLAVEVLPLPLGFWVFALLCLNAYISAEPTDAWTALRVARYAFGGLVLSILLTVGLHLVPVATAEPLLPWILGVSYSALAAFLGLGAWWWVRARFEYTPNELLWVEGFWAPRRWAWSEFTEVVRWTEGHTTAVRLVTRNQDSVTVPLDWVGAEEMVRHVKATA